MTLVKAKGDIKGEIKCHINIKILNPNGLQK